MKRTGNLHIGLSSIADVTPKAGRIIYDAPIWDPTCPVALYLQSLGEESGSQATMLRVLHRVAKYMGVSHYKDVPWSDLQSHHVQQVINELKLNDLTPNTIGLYLSGIKGVARQAFLLKKMPLDAYTRIKEIKRPKGSRTGGAGSPLTHEQLQSVFDTCEADLTIAGVRDLAILGLLYGAGLRRQEVAKVRFPENIDFSSGLITIVGKGNKERQITMPDILEDWLERYIHIRGKFPGPFINRLRPTKNGLKLTQEGVTGQAVYDVCIARGANLEDARFTPHDYRRTYGTELNESGTLLTTIQKLLGHSNITTTQTYIRERSTSNKKETNKLSFGRKP